MNDNDRQHLLNGYREKLEEMCDEELLGEDYIEELRQQAIVDRVDDIEEDLNEESNEELLGEEYLKELRDEVIEEMVEEYEVELEEEAGQPA